MTFEGDGETRSQEIVGQVPASVIMWLYSLRGGGEEVAGLCPEEGRDLMIDIYCRVGKCLGGS